MNATLELYKLDLLDRSVLNNINTPYSMIIAVDDNRVSMTTLKHVCDSNPAYCHFYSFPSGKHVIHWGAEKTAFEDLLVNLINKQ